MYAKMACLWTTDGRTCDRPATTHEGRSVAYCEEHLMPFIRTATRPPAHPSVPVEIRGEEHILREYVPSSPWSS